jgi:hypothetical protein
MRAQAPPLVLSQAERLNDPALQEVLLSCCDPAICASHGSTELDEGGSGGILLTRRADYLGGAAEQHHRRLTRWSGSAEAHIWLQAETVSFKDTSQERRA